MKQILLSTCIAVALTGCKATNDNQYASIDSGLDNIKSNQVSFTKGLSQHIEQQKVDSVTRQVTAQGISYLENGDYTKASEYFNSALRLDLTNSYIQFMNAITYHLQAIKGDSEKLELAEPVAHL